PGRAGQRPGLVPDDEAARPLGRAPGRRLLRARGRRRDPRRARARSGRPGRRPAARLRPRLPLEGLQRRVDVRERLPRTAVGRAGRRRRSGQQAGPHRAGAGARAPDETVGAAISYLREYNVSQMPVVRHEPPLRAAEVAGSVLERQLLAAVFADRSAVDAPVTDHLSPPLPTVGIGEPLSRIVAVLGDEPAVLVHDEGSPVGILTRADLLSFLAATP